MSPGCQLTRAANLLRCPVERRNGISAAGRKAGPRSGTPGGRISAGCCGDGDPLLPGGATDGGIGAGGAQRSIIGSNSPRPPLRERLCRRGQPRDGEPVSRNTPRSTIGSQSPKLTSCGVCTAAEPTGVRALLPLPFPTLSNAWAAAASLWAEAGEEDVAPPRLVGLTATGLRPHGEARLARPGVAARVALLGRLRELGGRPSEAPGACPLAPALEATTRPTGGGEDRLPHESVPSERLHGEPPDRLLPPDSGRATLLLQAFWSSAVARAASASDLSRSRSAARNFTLARSFEFSSRSCRDASSDGSGEAITTPLSL